MQLSRSSRLTYFLIALIVFAVLILKTSKHYEEEPINISLPLKVTRSRIKSQKEKVEFKVVNGWKGLYKKPRVDEHCTNCRIHNMSHLANTHSECLEGFPCIALATPFFFTFKPWEKMIANECEFQCTYVYDVTQADAVVFNARDIDNTTISRWKRHHNQFWIYLSTENPISTIEIGYDVQQDQRYRHFFNWTATYMRDSDIYTPYGEFTTQKSPIKNAKLFDKSLKTKFAYILSSQCISFNKRKKALDELSKVMDIDFYGFCYDRPMALVMRRPNIFEQLAKRYHFYISFENSYCKDYITEKFFYNALSTSAIPVVFGGYTEDDYKAIAPNKSYIYGPNFSTYASLAANLKYLVNNETVYSEYFEWKRTKRLKAALREDRLLCNVCRKLYTDLKPNVADLKHYYRPDNCRNYTKHVV